MKNPRKVPFLERGVTAHKGQQWKNGSKMWFTKPLYNMRNFWRGSREEKAMEYSVVWRYQFKKPNYYYHFCTQINAFTYY